MTDEVNPNRCHPSHILRSSDASTFDVVCILCNNTDIVPGGWGKLSYPCPAQVEFTEEDSDSIINSNS